MCRDNNIWKDRFRPQILTDFQTLAQPRGRDTISFVTIGWISLLLLCFLLLYEVNGTINMKCAEICNVLAGVQMALHAVEQVQDEG